MLRVTGNHTTTTSTSTTVTTPTSNNLMSMQNGMLVPKVETTGYDNCQHCRLGDFPNSFRISVKNNSDARSHLFHVHKNESCQSIMIRLCEEYPESWSRGQVYYFYIDVGGHYHHLDDSSWLRDKDVLIVTTVDDLQALPTISLSAVHASLRPEVELRPHQIDGVNQMIHLERSRGGGFLADEMGLGKTIQALTVILRRQPLTNTHACTLVIVPSHGIGDQWADEIRSKTTYGSLPYFIYQDDSIPLIDQPCFRVIITTYDRVRNEYKKIMQGIDNESPLYNIDWHRIILDESHKLRARTMLASAVTSLKGKFKWCLSGTPFQNDVTELYPIFQFLGIELDQKKKHDEDYVTGLLKAVMIRRTKSFLFKELTILPKQERRITLEFSPPERALYDYLERLLYHQISLLKSTGYRNHHIVSAAILYLRLKQGKSCRSSHPNDVEIAQQLGGSEVARDRCYYEEVSEYEQALEIIESYYDQFGNLQEPIDMSQLQRLKYIKHSTKATWLISYLRQLLASESSDKIVIVSQFVDVILKVSELLTTAKMMHTTYHGSISPYARRVALHRFNHDPRIRVMVMSLKAGGVGLNLQKANHMIILDRWWNPATMDQAVARIHRMNQLKETYIHTVVIKDTIEESLMDNILDKKNALFKKIVEHETRFGKEVRTLDQMAADAESGDDTGAEHQETDQESTLSN
ncbi:SNF2 family N-terminal domain-containing protein [Mycotypha africana]|uniref:SNF2 family N-terminal domain-containing protein n=1 Tax=Mycotypha africana TaxID=64632 RepID=UPI0023019BF6|nr:SNF2 family N-terminal domain-containing protein [Mycotypha africana]KAI8972029.1 SNF2 family N-terminal domain-containing protein [Mycotypha africana]